jgi:hypothetical protein
MSALFYRRKFTAKYVVKFVADDQDGWSQGLIKNVRALPPYETEQQALDAISDLMNTVPFYDIQGNSPGSGLFEIARAVVGEWEAITAEIVE